MEQTTALDIYINSQIKRFNITDAAIQELQNKYSNLPCIIMETGANYKENKAFRIEVKKLRCEVENRRKEIVQDSVKFKRAVDDEAKRITEKLSVIEFAIEHHEKAYEAEQERIKKEAEEAAKARYQKRVKMLSEIEFKFNGTEYYFGKSFITNADVKDLPDDEFAFMFTGFFGEWNAEVARREEEKRLAAELKAKQEAEAAAERQRLAQQRAEQEAREKALAEREAALKAESERLEAEQEKVRLSLEYDRKVREQSLSAEVQGKINIQHPVSIPDWEDDEEEPITDNAIKDVLNGMARVVGIEPVVEPCHAAVDLGVKDKTVTLEISGKKVDIVPANEWEITFNGKFKAKCTVYAGSLEDARDQALSELENHDQFGESFQIEFEVENAEISEECY